MSHHSPDFDPEIYKQFGLPVDEQFNDIRHKLEEIAAIGPTGLGPTGQFPEGKLTKKDEGEIQFAIAHKDGKVIVDFGVPVSWVGMNPDQAETVGRALIDHAEKARR